MYCVADLELQRHKDQILFLCDQYKNSEIINLDGDSIRVSRQQIDDFDYWADVKISKNKKGQMNYINYDLNWVNMGELSLGNGGEEIEIKDIDSLMLPKIDIIKIDVQGYEKFVLEGTLNKINSDKPIIIIELENFQMQKFDYDDSYIFSFFKNLGYIPFYLESNYPSDHVFVHESQINSFYEKNKILNLTEKNSLNNNLDNGVKFKIIKGKLNIKNFYDS